jgi:hypothetical protein
MQNIIGKAVRPIELEAYEILRAIHAYEYSIATLMKPTDQSIARLRLG